MMILFNNQEQVIRYVRSDVTRVLEHKQKLTDERYVSDNLYAEVEALGQEVLEQLEYVAIPVEGMTYQYHYFWVQKHETSGNITSIQGVQSGIEALRKTPVRDFRPQERDARFAIERLLEGTNWQTGYVADTGKRSTTVYFTSVFEALKKFCSVWQLEMQFFVEVTDGRIGARYIDFRERLGKRRGARVVYGHNALEIVKEEERTELYTALIGRGKGEEVSSEEENESGQAGYGRKINFEEIVWSQAAGDPVDKPAGQLYVELPEATERFGVRGTDGQMKPKIGFVEFQDEEDRQRLLQLTYEELKRLSRPQVMFKTSSVYVAGQIGDVIRVVRPDRHLDYETRIFEITWDRLLGTAVDIKLGDQLNESANKRESRITGNAVSAAVDELAAGLGEHIEKRVDFLVSSNGFNRNYCTKEDPWELGYAVKVGDLWFRPDPDSEGDDILYMWNGEFWEELVRTADTDHVKRLIEKLESEWAAWQKQADDRQEANDRDIEAFEETLEEFSKRVDAIDDLDVDAWVKQVIENAGFDKELQQKVADALESAGFGGALDELKSRLDIVSETARINAEVIGGDGTTRYNKNRADVTEALIELGDFVEIGPTGEDGWPVDEAGNLAELTISFNAECLPHGYSAVQVAVDAPMMIGSVSVALDPDNPLYPNLQQETTTGEMVIHSVYHDRYSVVVSGNWYKSVSDHVVVDGEKEFAYALAFKSVADGLVDGGDVGVWSDEPTMILDAGAVHTTDGRVADGNLESELIGVWSIEPLMIFEGNDEID